MAEEMIHIGVVGVGYWGPKLLRNFNGLPNCAVKTVVDKSEVALQLVKNQYKNIKFSTDIDDILSDKTIQGVVIATPVHSHYSIALACLKAGKHVLVEKPLAPTYREAKQLSDYALKKNLILMVDHTLLYTGAVKKIHQVLQRKELGTINYFDSSRINLGLLQSDINVLWDLAPHDIAVLMYLIEEKPTSVQAVGRSHNSTGIENIAFMTLIYDSGLIAHFNCSWVSPIKERRTIIGGTEKMLVYNDLEPKEKIKIYDSKYEVLDFEFGHHINVSYEHGDVITPTIDDTEALFSMAEDFALAISKQEVPQSNVDLGVSVVHILDAAQTSLEQKGARIDLNL
jgi:predicted dehydrogenase